MVNTRIIAVCGKGGVGKTSISALIIKVLLEQPGKRILAIDADPAVGFSTALGVEVGKTVDDVRNEIIKTSREGSRENKRALLARLNYKVFEAMVEREGFAFLAIGRPEADGCYCKVNDYLKEIIESLAADFDYVVIDGEAGIEQINRRVMDKVSHLLLLSDTSLKGLNVVKTLSEVATGVVEYERMGVILNRVRSESELDRVDISKLELLTYIPENDMIRDFDIQGKSLLGLAEGSAVNAVRNGLKAFNFID